MDEGFLWNSIVLIFVLFVGGRLIPIHCKTTHHTRLLSKLVFVPFHLNQCHEFFIFCRQYLYFQEIFCQYWLKFVFCRQYFVNVDDTVAQKVSLFNGFSIYLISFFLLYFFGSIFVLLLFFHLLGKKLFIVEVFSYYVV